MQLEGLVWCIECEGNHHLSNHVRTNPSSKLFSTTRPPLVMCHWHGLTIQACGLLDRIMGSLAMDMTRGIGTLSELLCPIIAPQNSGFFFFSPSYLRRKIGFWLWHTNPARFFDFHTWKRHFACPTIVLTFRSLQCLIKCSRRRFVPHILRWDGDPTTDISP